MIINGQALIKAAPIKDMLTEKRKSNGVSHGLTECGYDVTIAQDVVFTENGVCVDDVWTKGKFTLASTLEMFEMPFDLVGVLHDKSTWARLGLSVFSGTIIEPGWRGYLTLEMVYHGAGRLHVPAGTGIAQVIFHGPLAEMAVYRGKYQDQVAGPVKAKFEVLA